MNELEKFKGMLGGYEAAGSVASGMLAQPIAGLAGLLALPGGPEKAASAVRKTQEALTYQPRTQYGQTGLAAIADFMSPFANGLAAVQQATGDAGYAVGGPVGGMLGATLPDAAMMAIPAMRNPKGIVNNAMTQRTLDPQRGIFAGVGAKTADLAQFEQAQRMAKAGMSADDIWRDTGWFQGADKKWRFEIDDSNSIPGHRLYSWGESEDLKNGNSTVVRRQKALLHPELSAAYPETKSLVTNIDPRRDGGSFSPEAWSIRTGASKENGAANRSTMLHELQHAVQQREGFASGGSPRQMGDEMGKLNDLNRRFNDAFEQYVTTTDKTAKANAGQQMKFYKDQIEGLRQLRNATSPEEAYARLAGEVESRAVQSRMNLTPEQRKALPPWQSYDVPINQMIVR